MLIPNWNFSAEIAQKPGFVSMIHNEAEALILQTHQLPDRCWNEQDITKQMLSNFRHNLSLR
jgi:hypothetical protein